MKRKYKLAKSAMPVLPGTPTSSTTQLTGEGRVFTVENSGAGSNTVRSSSELNEHRARAAADLHHAKTVLERLPQNSEQYLAKRREIRELQNRADLFASKQHTAHKSELRYGRTR
jgi:hypothetical protein